VIHALLLTAALCCAHPLDSDIVSMRVESIVLLLTYLRDKFDLDFLFQKLLNEDLKDEEKEIHMHVTTAVADQEEVHHQPSLALGLHVCVCGGGVWCVLCQV
jgi:hypothetical protein